MKKILITGAKGFIGKNLISALGRDSDIFISTFDVDDEPNLLASYLKEVDFIFHLAGVNRPQNTEEFSIGNTQSTASLVENLKKSGRSVPILLTSSIQAELDSPYGKSKKAAEDVLIDYNKRTGAPIYLYRLPGVFGKWSRPNYNTVVATFCHNIARGIDIKISDPSNEIELVYIDDVVSCFIQHIKESTDNKSTSDVIPACPESFPVFNKIDRTFKITLGELATRIQAFHDIRTTLTVPDLSDDFTRCLHATYLSFLPEEEFSYAVKLNTDNRGWLFELIKSPHFGQIFVSKTLPGITRGNHYHDSKTEKFCVVQGEGVIRFRHILSKELIEYAVDGTAIQILDIPPGYTHSIENTGKGEMITLFWANQFFDPENPDTFYSPVVQ